MIRKSCKSLATVSLAAALATVLGTGLAQAQADKPVVVKKDSGARCAHLFRELGANVEFGDADRKTLYIAARTSIYKIRVKIAGIPWRLRHSVSGSARLREGGDPGPQARNSIEHSSWIPAGACPRLDRGRK